MLTLGPDHVIWLDGQFVPWTEVSIPALSHGLHYGTGVFEGVRAYPTDQGPAIFRLKDHTDRLLNSAKILNMTVPYSAEELNHAQVELLQRNQLEDAYIRPLSFFGPESMSLYNQTLNTYTLIAAWHWDSYLGQENLKRGVSIQTSSFTHRHANSTLSKAKATGNYLSSMLALEEAKRNGYDEALMLDSDGHVVEGSAEHLFIVRGGELFTPPVTGTIEGITRDTILKLAKEQGLTVTEKLMTRDEVYIADEAFFTGTAVEVTPIAKIDGREIGKGSRGSITEKLQRGYFDLVHGRSKHHSNWLTYVRKEHDRRTENSSQYETAV